MVTLMGNVMSFLKFKEESNFKADFKINIINL